MMSVSDFISLPKIDAHNHLNLGMRYASYAPWAGFYIPDFPRKLNGLGEMHEIIGQYTRPRAKTAKDITNLLSLSIQDAVADGVSILEGSVDIQFVGHCGSIENFLKMVQDIQAKFSTRIDFRPELGMGKTFDMEKIRAWVPACLESGLFKSIDLYGPEIEDGIEDFDEIYKLAGKLGIKKKAHVGEFSNAASVRNFIEFFDLDEVQHGIGAVQDESVMQFIKDRKLRLNICPASNVMLGAVKSLADHPIKQLVAAGINVSIATDDLLFFNRTVAEQSADLVEAGTLTKEQIKTIFESNTAEYVK
ncbi:adenosine deaminase [Treponema brennaborense]|uniref:Adenosine deaminase n=1 Tax=Treponema brennaborense (strain DSM 12168 / CIP 105900 / DD5/3) TaxID=906968 RepID=F4LPU0_TREBD|nr:adenosine deaminase [Treponema brennaborense]AEE16032.1 Adenosine deaminase [Treponema brennaborense DSM 12168]